MSNQENSSSDQIKITGSKRTNLQTSTRTRPHSVHHTARVLVFEDTDNEQNQGQNKKVSSSGSGSGSSSMSVPYRESSAPIPYRKTSYQPNYLRPTMGGPNSNG